MKRILRANLYFLTILVLEIVAPIFLAPLYYILNITDTRVVLLLNHVILFIIPAIVYIIATKSSFKKTLRLNRLGLKQIFLVIVLSFAVQPIMSFFSLIASFFFTNEIGGFVTEISSMPYLLLLGLIAVLPSISEEVTIRGIVLSGYEEKNKYIAAAVTGLFFGILHLDPHQFLYTAVLGFILALLVRITNSIYSSMIMHFIINGTSATLAKLSNMFSLGVEAVNETEELAFEYLSLSEKLTILYVFAALAAVFIVVVYYLFRKLEKISNKEVINGNNAIELSYSFRTVDDTIIKDRIINIPFILSIMIYILYMFKII